MHGYVDDGAQVLVVADGTVGGIEDSLEDQTLGTLPDPAHYQYPLDLEIT